MQQIPPEKLVTPYQIVGFPNPKYHCLIRYYNSFVSVDKASPEFSLRTVFFNTIKVFTFDPFSLPGQLALKKMGT